MRLPVEGERLKSYIYIYTAQKEETKRLFETKLIHIYIYMSEVLHVELYCTMAFLCLLHVCVMSQFFIGIHIECIYHHMKKKSVT